MVRSRGESSATGDANLLPASLAGYRERAAARPRTGPSHPGGGRRTIRRPEHRDRGTRERRGRAPARPDRDVAKPPGLRQRTGSARGQLRVGRRRTMASRGTHPGDERRHRRRPGRIDLVRSRGGPLPGRWRSGVEPGGNRGGRCDHDRRLRARDAPGPVERQFCVERHEPGARRRHGPGPGRRSADAQDPQSARGTGGLSDRGGRAPLWSSTTTSTTGTTTSRSTTAHWYDNAKVAVGITSTPKGHPSATGTGTTTPTTSRPSSKTPTVKVIADPSGQAATFNVSETSFTVKILADNAPCWVQAIEQGNPTPVFAQVLPAGQSHFFKVTSSMTIETGSGAGRASVYYGFALLKTYVPAKTPFTMTFNPAT